MSFSANRRARTPWDRSLEAPLRGLAVLALALGVSGCTAVKSSVHLVQAEQIVTKAEQRNADDEAIYEFTMAVRYLEKAREENGYADYKDSSELSKEATKWAEKSIDVVETGGPSYRPPKPEGALPGPDETETGDGLDDLPDGPAPAPATPDDSGDELPEANDDLLEDE